MGIEGGKKSPSKEESDSWKIVRQIESERGSNPEADETKDRFNIVMALMHAIPGQEGFIDHMEALVNNLNRRKLNDFSERAQAIIDNYQTNPSDESVMNGLLKSLKEDIRNWMNDPDSFESKER